MAASENRAGGDMGDDVPWLSPESSITTSAVSSWIKISPELTKSQNLRKRLLSGPTVDVIVGRERRRWMMHVNLLCHHSEPLASQLLGQRSPGDVSSGEQSPSPGSPYPSTPMTLDLPDADPAGFELLVKWMYQGKLDSVSRLANDEQKYEYAVACHKLYNLCDRFDLPQLKNKAIDEYRRGLSESGLVPDAEELNEIYRSSPDDAPFRKLMVHIAARQIMDPDAEKDADEYRACFNGNADFAVELINAIKVGTGGLLFDDPTTGSECAWHDHSDGTNCTGKGKHKQERPISYRLPKPAPKRRRRLSPAAPPAPAATPQPNRLDNVNGVDGPHHTADASRGSSQNENRRHDAVRQLGNSSVYSAMPGAYSNYTPDTRLGAKAGGPSSTPRSPGKSRPARPQTPTARSPDRNSGGKSPRGTTNGHSTVVNGARTPERSKGTPSGHGKTPGTGSARRQPPKLRRRGSPTPSQ